MAYLNLESRLMLFSGFAVVFLIDLLIAFLGWAFRKKYSFISPKIYGLFVGNFAEKIIRKFGIGFRTLAIFMLPVFVLTSIWAWFASGVQPRLVYAIVGILVGFHLTLLFMFMVKISSMMVLEKKFGKSYKARVKKAISALVD